MPYQKNKMLMCGAWHLKKKASWLDSNKKNEKNKNINDFKK